MDKIIKYTKYLSRKITASRIGAYSAQTAYFMFLSLIPLVMLALSLLNQFDVTTEAVAGVTNDFAPEIVRNFFSSYITELLDGSKLSLTIVSAVILLWSASKGVFSIISGLNSVYEIKESRNYFMLRLLAMFYTVALVAVILVALLFMVFGDSINSLVSSFLPKFKGLAYIISSLRFIIGFLILVCFFTVLYKMLPSGKQRFSDQIPGAVLSSLGWVSFSILFSFFVENFSNYNAIYGSLTAIIVLMLWLYICMYILFLGAEINQILINNTEK